MSTDNAYDVLGVSRTATNEEIVSAYRTASFKHHPDRCGGSAQEFQKVSAAYELLIDPERRARYDKTGDSSERADPVLEVVAKILNDSLLSIVKTGRDPEQQDVVSLMSKNVDDKIAELEHHIESATKQVEKIKKIAARFSTKSNSDNVLKKITLSSAVELERAIDADRKLLATFKAAYGIIKQYSYQKDSSISERMFTVNKLWTPGSDGFNYAKWGGP